MVQIKKFTFNILGTNCYIVWEEGSWKCIVADPGMYRDFERDELISYLSREGLTPEAILLTHAHFDHVWGVQPLVEAFGCPVYLSRKDDEVLRAHSGYIRKAGLKTQVEIFDYQDVNDGDILEKGGCRWKVIATPGHTPGGVCYYCEEAGILLSGDTLFQGSIGRTDLEGGNYDDLIRSIMDSLMGLPGDTDVLPGHGAATSIGREAMTNPFLIPFNEPIPDWNAEGLSLDGE